MKQIDLDPAVLEPLEGETEEERLERLMKLKRSTKGDLLENLRELMNLGDQVKRTAATTAKQVLKINLDESSERHLASEPSWPFDKPKANGTNGER